MPEQLEKYLQMSSEELAEAVRDAKADEASELNQLGRDAQIEYLMGWEGWDSVVGGLSRDDCAEALEKSLSKKPNAMVVGEFIRYVEKHFSHEASFNQLDDLAAEFRRMELE